MQTPTLVIHGALDYRVPDAQGLAYYNTLKARGVDARLVWFPDENHWVLKPRNSKLWYGEFFDWLKRHDAKPAKRGDGSDAQPRLTTRRRHAAGAHAGRSLTLVTANDANPAVPCASRTGYARDLDAMLIDFFYTLRAAKLPVSVKEYLTLLEAVREGVIGPSVDDFYVLARTALVKDEALFDKFDRAFSAYFKGVELLADFTQDIPLEWLRKTLELELSPEDKAKIEKMGWDELMETLKKRFEEQKGRHEGGSKMIGTGGTSPFGAYGYNPQGIRIGQAGGRNKSAVKVWDQRAYKDYDDSLRARHAQHQGRAAPAAPLRARRLRARARPRRHDPRHRRQRRPARHQDGSRAAQQGEGAAADGRRRHDGRAHPPRRGAVLRGEVASSSTWSSTTSTTASTTSCGRTTGGASRRSSRPGT